MAEKLCKDGLFEIVRVSNRQSAGATNRVILICRAGRLFGADAKGRVYTGELRSHDLGRQSSILLGNYEGPLRGSARALGDRNSSPGRFPLRAEIDPLASRQSATVRVGGLEVEVEINYLGPLPP